MLEANDKIRQVFKCYSMLEVYIALPVTISNVSP